jgi:protein TonB
VYAVSNPYLPALPASRAPRRVGIVFAVVLHATALAAILSYQPARSALLMAAPIMVNWIAEPRVEPRREPPKPKPIEKPEPKLVEAPLIVAQNPDPAPAEAPAPPPPPADPIVVAVPQPAMSLPIFGADYLDNPSPPYPALSRRLQEQGRVMLRVLVTAEGRAEQVRIQTSSGFARLDSSASDTVKHWKFVPAKRGAESVPAWVLIPVSFKLES